MDSTLYQYVLAAQTGVLLSAGFVVSVILLFAVLFCCLIFCLRRKRSIRKIRCMSSCQKTALLNEQLIKFGFVWLPSQEIISTTTDAWQRGFGYCALYDQTASLFNMVFDCEPVYFDYDGRTWLIELWKGQYGINTGGEIGIYRADRLVPPRETEQAHFESVPDSQMLPLTIELSRRIGAPGGNACESVHTQNSTSCNSACTADDAPGRTACESVHTDNDTSCVPAKRACCRELAPVFSVDFLHWWLAGFRMGEFSRPRDLVMRASITFPDECMLSAFTNALLVLGYRAADFTVYGLTVFLTFDEPHSLQPSEIHPIRACIAQLENRLFCRLYRCITKPFTETPDQLLYLYYLLPPAFTHMLTFRRSRTQKRRKHTLRTPKLYSESDGMTHTPASHGASESYSESGGVSHTPASHNAPEPYSGSGGIPHMPSRCTRTRRICRKMRNTCRRGRR